MQARPFLKLVRSTAVALVASIMAGVSLAADIDTSARQAILVDVTSGTVLFEKNADERMPTSSMSKLMTMYMVFEALEQGRLSFEDRLPVSERAWRMGGSKMYVDINTLVRVEDLVRGVIIQSGNDACIVLAEALAGSEEAFGRQMTERAQELGLVRSNFVNSSGWPHPDHYSTARDLAYLASRIISDFPQYYHFYSETEFTYHNIKQGNRNPLLYRNMDVDGLKTGHTRAAGYGLTASAERNGRRLILVVNGLDNVQARADEAARLIEWGFREFDLYTLFGEREVVEEVPVWFGDLSTVPAIVPGGLKVTMAQPERDGLTVTMVLDAPVPAPIARGDRVGTLVITAPGFVARDVPLVAATDVQKLGFVGRIGAAAAHVLFGWL